MEGERKYLTDEEYNKLFDEVAKNESLTPDELDALTRMRDDMYERMTYMKDNEDYKEKYEELADRYKRRWREGDKEEWKGFKETEKNRFQKTVEEPDGDKVTYKDLFTKKEED